MLKCWSSFVEQIHPSEKRVTVFESTFLQSTIEQMRYADLPDSDIQSFVDEVMRICEAFNPCLIYLYENDIAGGLKRICKERGKEFTDWFVDWNANFAYPQNRSLDGFDGLVKCYQDFRRLNKTLIADCGIPTLFIDRLKGDWTTYHHQIMNFLDLPYLELPKESKNYLQQFVGTYKIIEGPPRHEVDSYEIRLENGDLILYNFWNPRSRLLYKSKDIFYIEGVCIEFHFQTAIDSKDIRVTLGGKWEGWFYERVLSRIHNT